MLPQKFYDSSEGANKEEHYERLKIQPVEYIHANGLDFFEGNVIKYISRHRTKGGLKDLLKAKDYIDMIIKNDYTEKE